MNISATRYPVDKLESIAKVLRTIAHPVRLEILNVLSIEDDIDVSTICSKIGMTCEISMMSHHLTKMKDNGILKSEKKGKRVFYQLTDPGILKIFDCMESCDIF